MPLKLGQANARAVASRELESASLYSMGVANPSGWVKPELQGKQRPNALCRLPGVKGDSARGKNRPELGRPGPKSQPQGADNPRWETITT